MKLDYNILKKSGGKTIKIDKNSSDTYVLGEMVGTLGHTFINNKKSNFSWREYAPFSIQILNGYITFKNKCRVELV